MALLAIGSCKQITQFRTKVNANNNNNNSKTNTMKKNKKKEEIEAVQAAEVRITRNGRKLTQREREIESRVSLCQNIIINLLISVVYI